MSTESVKKRRRGDVREDGKVFWHSEPRKGTSKRYERWVSPDKFRELATASALYYKKTRVEVTQKIRIKNRKKSLNTKKYRRGDTREDGMVFWSLDKNKIDGERWISKERYGQMSNWCKEYAREYANNRRKNDPVFKARNRFQARLGYVFKRIRSGYTYATSGIDSLVGCNSDQFMDHIYSLLQKGMTPENYGEWELDHVIPVSKAKNIGDLISLYHYTNMRPLWKIQNRHGLRPT